MQGVAVIRSVMGLVGESSVAGIAPHMTRLFGTVTPEPGNHANPSPRSAHADAPANTLEHRR